MTVKSRENTFSFFYVFRMYLEMQDEDVETGISSGGSSAEDKRHKRMKRSKLAKTPDIPKCSQFTPDQVSRI